ncbi:MAG: sulfite exporter TauE/SafE family protein [Pikeienuella sp.]
MALPAGLDAHAFVPVLAIFVFGGFIKGGLGFGLPLATISLLPLVIPVDMALAINTIVQPITNLGQLWGSGRGREAVARFWPMLPPLAVGVALGALLVKSIPPDTLTLVLGIFIMVFCTLSVSGWVLPIKPTQERAAGIGTGFAAGIVGALTAANGPVFVIYLMALKLDQALFRATLGFLFVVSGALVAGGFASVGFLDWGRTLLALLCVPSALLGMWLGTRLARRLAAEAFRRAVLVGLFCLGANFSLRGLNVI